MFALPSLFLPKIFTESSPIPEPSFSWDKHRGAVPWFIHELSQEGFPAVPEALENSCSEQPGVHTEGGIPRLHSLLEFQLRGAEPAFNGNSVGTGDPCTGSQQVGGLERGSGQEFQRERRVIPWCPISQAARAPPAVDSVSPRDLAGLDVPSLGRDAPGYCPYHCPHFLLAAHPFFLSTFLLPG